MPASNLSMSGRHVDHRTRQTIVDLQRRGDRKTKKWVCELKKCKGGLGKGPEGLWIRQHQMVQMLTRHSLLPRLSTKTTSQATFYWHSLFSLHSRSLLLPSAAGSPPSQGQHESTVACQSSSLLQLPSFGKDFASCVARYVTFTFAHINSNSNHQKPQPFTTTDSGPAAAGHACSVRALGFGQYSPGSAQLCSLPLPPHHLPRLPHLLHLPLRYQSQSGQ